jgi:chaperonin GroEL (HSP60 family)
LLNPNIHYPSKNCLPRAGNHDDPSARRPERRRAFSTKADYGYNAVADSYEDLIAAGLIDSDQGREHRARNATSVTSLTLTTEALIAEHSSRSADRARE